MRGRPQIFSRAPVSCAAISAAAILLLAACERPVEEPPPSRPKDPTSITIPAQTAAIPVASAVAAPLPAGRCITPTPATPRRLPPNGADSRCPHDPDTAPKLRAGKVVFSEAKGAPASTVEIAEKDADRQRGLMYRTKMADDRGMIFTFGEKEDHTFWMHNTCISLDMLFIDDDGMIVGIEESTPTMSDSTFSVGCLSKYVLELNAGWTRAHGVVAGQKVKLEGI
ncbi:MAG: DUF192 domain-containing protein [Byssovorax sp.]